MQPGRFCPVHYRYSPADIAAADELRVPCLYIIGGLYGNTAALDTILQMAAAEPVRPVLVFNGDFNWFNIDAASFAGINGTVLAHTALRGNVETELAAADESAGCGCGYPDFVDDVSVARSNAIMQKLRATAAGLSSLRQQLGRLPMYARASVGGVRIAIVHGDCESLAGWGLSQEALADTTARERAAGWCAQAKADIVASSHSCLPVLLDQETAQRRSVIVNNGAAGMPNFRNTQCGLITRIGTGASPHPPVYGTRIGDVSVDALAVRYDHARWLHDFAANWPAGSAACLSYEKRIVEGPDYGIEDALRVTARTTRPLAA